ncbi:Alpha/Beta hydrolase protein [Podospora didyma]|uniref:Alpha/Beta hydrolase protein n=1 Tax=Podospora didyma TaxID=330526 RepID=A0AAE0KKM2_9PEZI|nr:Alpha/Beta hydrolase protein [Podospora didyma]
MAPTRIPTEEDFAALSPDLTISLSYPTPRESTTSILLLFHGLGDSDAPFAGFARNLTLPGVLGVSVRGTSPLPPALLGDSESTVARHFHWGDDLTLAPGGGGELDPDPGFEKAQRLVLDRLVRETLVGKCGWTTRDLLLFGFGQGGSFALGLASRLRGGGGGGGEGRVTELTDDETEKEEEEEVFKGVVSVGGPLPASMIPSLSAREKAKTPVLVCRGSESEAVDEDAVDVLREEFAEVKVVVWKRPDDGMPRSRDEVLPLMQFFAERLNTGWP